MRNPLTRLTKLSLETYNLKQYAGELLLKFATNTKTLESTK